MSPVLAGGFLTTVPPGKSPTYSVLNIQLSKLSFETVFVTEVSGENLKKPGLQLLDCQMGRPHLKPLSMLLLCWSHGLRDLSSPIRD